VETNRTEIIKETRFRLRVGHAANPVFILGAQRTDIEVPESIRKELD
jgi:hypothetical protein